MKIFFYPALFLLGFFTIANAQTNNNYPQWQHPILKELRTGSKTLTPFYNKDSTAFVTVSVIDKKEKKIYWFDCFGYYFDAVPISNENLQALIAKKITAFKYYDLITTNYLTTITKARANFQSNGNKAIFTVYEKQLLQIDDSIKFPSTLKKLIELDKQKLSIERQIREFHSINPTKIKEDTAFSKTLSLQYGSMQTTYQDGDSITTYYNRIALEPVYKAVLNNSAASVKYFNRGNQLIDEIQFDISKIELLREEKTDIFLLYRGWLEMQRYEIIESIADIQTAKKELTQSKSDIGKSEFINTSNSYQSLLNYASQLLKSTNYKIDYLTTIDRGFVSQCLKQQYRQTSNSLSANEAYLSTFTRGNKFYELTDARGNVMAVVTDKKLQHSSNGNTVDYYEPDIVAATDYAPFGSPLPGRNFQSDKYRYGYNGKENDNEVKGQGNQIDFGSRIYDPRLGRFLSVDPMQRKYASLSPYLFALNNPIVMIDRDGEDAIVSITRNKDGGGTIKVQTVIHITGTAGGAGKWLENVYNKGAKERYKDQQVNVDGKVWNIQYDIKYEYDKNFDVSKMTKGHNMLKSDPNTPASGPNRTHVNNPNNTGLIAPSHLYPAEVVNHETGHEIGFTDRYTEINADNADFKAYIANKYNTKEDLAPGGNNYKRLEVARQKQLSIGIPDEGYENNEMQNNNGGFTDEQNKALVNKVLSVSNGVDGTFIITGIFDRDTKGKPSPAAIQKACETLDAQIQTEINKVEKKP